MSKLTDIPFPWFQLFHLKIKNTLLSSTCREIRSWFGKLKRAFKHDYHYIFLLYTPVLKTLRAIPLEEWALGVDFWNLPLQPEHSAWFLFLSLPQPISSVKPICMENLSVNQGNGQSSGYILYETVITNSGLLTTRGHLQDRGQVRDSGWVPVALLC